MAPKPPKRRSRCDGTDKEDVCEQTGSFDALTKMFENQMNIMNQIVLGINDLKNVVSDRRKCNQCYT